MVLRMWKARATDRQAAAYIEYAMNKVFPKIRALEGYRGEYLLRREVGNRVELVVLTLWDSMEAVRRFAGAETNKAVVEPEARAVLSSFDELVTHFEVVDGNEGGKR